MHQSSHSHFERPTSSKPEFPLAQRIMYLMLVIAVGILSGALGIVLIRIVYQPFFQQTILPYQLSGQYNISPNNSFIQTGQSSVTPGQINSTAASIVSIYRHQSRGTTTLDLIPDPRDFKSEGVVITSDGWIMTDASVINSSEKYDVIKDGSIYPATNVVVNDFARVAFLDIEAHDLIPASFIQNEAQHGQLLYSLNFKNLSSPVFTRSFVSAINYFPMEHRSDYIKTSDAINNFELIAPEISLAGTGLFTPEGQLAGIVSLSSGPVMLIPSKYLRVAVDQLFQNVNARTAGISYVELSILSDREQSPGIEVMTVLPTSLLANKQNPQEGILRADRLLSINAEKINASQPFDYLWYKLQGSSKADFTLERNGRIITISISLQR